MAGGTKQVVLKASNGFVPCFTISFDMSFRMVINWAWWHMPVTPGRKIKKPKIHPLLDDGHDLKVSLHVFLLQKIN